MITHPAELARRMVKAESFADLLKQAEITPFQVERAGDEAWDQLAHIATLKARETNPKALQFHRPSDETKRLIIRFLNWADESPFEGIA